MGCSYQAPRKYIIDWDLFVEENLGKAGPMGMFTEGYLLDMFVRSLAVIHAYMRRSGVLPKNKRLCMSIKSRTRRAKNKSGRSVPLLCVHCFPSSLQPVIETHTHTHNPQTRTQRGHKVQLPRHGARHGASVQAQARHHQGARHGQEGQAIRLQGHGGEGWFEEGHREPRKVRDICLLLNQYPLTPSPPKPTWAHPGASRHASSSCCER